MTQLLSYFSAFNPNLELVHPECTLGAWNFSKKWLVMIIMPWVVTGRGLHSSTSQLNLSRF